MSWSILSNRDSSQVYSKTKSMFGLATTFHLHWVLMAWEISLVFVVFLNLNESSLQEAIEKTNDFLCFVYFSIHSQNFVGIFPINPHKTTTRPLV